ncbi:MAG: hypothetical protein KUG77_10220, partial [Nannocystaceae bacterium]|nr:hypothetical protein [Nannocystaceae bacterium]
MRLSTTAGFVAGCGLALVLLAGLAGGHVMLDGMRGQTSSSETELASLRSMTPAAGSASEHTVMPPVPGPWSDVPVQRPHELREGPPVAPLPPLPFH